MIFSPKDMVAGFPVKRIRDLLRKFEVNAWYSEERIAYHFKDTLKAAKQLTKELLARQWLKKHNGGYAITPLGRRAAAARIGTPLTREKADKLLNDVLARVKEWNGLEGVQLKITEVIVFGSYLGAATQLGDLDLAVKYERTANYSMEREDFEQFAQTNGMRISNVFLEMIRFWESNLFKFIKNRQPAVSFCYWEILETLNCPTKVVLSLPFDEAPYIPPQPFSRRLTGMLPSNTAPVA